MNPARPFLHRCGLSSVLCTSRVQRTQLFQRRIPTFTKPSPFATVVARRFQSSSSLDGLRNNRDLSNPSTESRNINSTDAELLSKLSKPLAEGQKEVPSYAMVFTCKKCSERSAHKISKQAYHNGTVLVQCPGCKSRHLMADHLKIFSDDRITLEDILAKKGDLLNKAVVNSTGDIEFLEKPDTTKDKP